MILYMEVWHMNIRIINSAHNQLTVLASRAFIDGVPWGEAYGSCLCVAIGCCQSNFLEKIEHYIDLLHR